MQAIFLNLFYFILNTHDFNFLYFQELVISQNFSGHLVAHSDWPTPLKNKGVFFIKREMKPLPKENFLNELTCGDIHPNALDHFCAWVEEVSLIFPLFPLSLIFLFLSVSSHIIGHRILN